MGKRESPRCSGHPPPSQQIGFDRGNGVGDLPMQAQHYYTPPVSLDVEPSSQANYGPPAVRAAAKCDRHTNK
jgi:hypothetical protein